MLAAPGTERPFIPDPSADRYPSTPMLMIWSPEARIVTERRFWIVVMKNQRRLGMSNITEAAIADYERCTNVVDLDSIRRRELELKHDVLARIAEFNALAGHELIHIGMTSRDLTENVEQMQMRLSMELISRKLVAVFARLLKHMSVFQYLPIAGRSHNVVGQMTTLGKRFANTAEELGRGYRCLEHCLDDYPLRGIKGPMGTQQDMFEYLKDAEKVSQLEAAVAEHLDFASTWTSVGQVYPRTLDFEVISAFVQIAAAAANFTNTLRLMAGHELATEGFSKLQEGSSSMPHKRNARTSERIKGLYAALCGYLAMIERPAGDQWNEGDVSCSVVRRIALPGACFAIDGQLEAWLTVLDDYGAYPAMIEREVERYLPFLATTKLMAAAVQRGMGREAAHRLIGEHAKAAGVSMSMRGTNENRLLELLAGDERWPLNISQTADAIGQPIEFIGLSASQVSTMMERIKPLCDADPEAAAYEPEEIL